MSINKSVAVLRCEEYDADLILDKMHEAWELTGGEKTLNVSGKKVLLKPNVLMDASPLKAITTNPEFLRAAIRLMKKLGAAEIYAGDSPGFQKPGFKAKKCGLGQICLEEGAVWYDFSNKTTIIKCPDGKMVNQFQVSDIVNKVDLIISLPKLKTHQLMYFTGAVKNQFGLLPGLTKSPYHMMFPGRGSFASMIVDLHMALKPAYAFMDGIISMEGPGPGNGIPKKTDLILASSNLPALDITACRIIGYDPDVVPVNRDAIDRGIWLESSHDVEIKGLTLHEAKVHQFQKIKLTGSRSQLLEFITPPFIRKLESKLSPRPLFREKVCIRCGECVKICPAEALTMTDRKSSSGKYSKMISIDYDKCIRCFCCHEVCPEDAIAVKRRLSDNGII